MRSTGSAPAMPGARRIWTTIAASERLYSSRGRASASLRRQPGRSCLSGRAPPPTAVSVLPPVPPPAPPARITTYTSSGGDRDYPRWRVDYRPPLAWTSYKPARALGPTMGPRQVHPVVRPRLLPLLLPDLLSLCGLFLSSHRIPPGSLLCSHCGPPGLSLLIAIVPLDVLGDAVKVRKKGEASHACRN